jgi:hypothetical protein
LRHTVTLGIPTLLVGAIFILQSTRVGADCSCGPDWCLNDPRFPPKLAAKKQALRKAGFSDDLISLLDRDGQCVAAVEQGPDTFFIKRRIGQGWDTRELNAEREEAAKADVLNGTVEAYYKFNTNRAFACCGQPAYNKRSDWNEKLDLNMSLAIVCKKSEDHVACDFSK